MAHTARRIHRPRGVAPVLRGLTIGLIGAGTMGQALIKGLIARGVSRRHLKASDPSGAVRRRVSRLGVRTVTQNEHVIRTSDVILLAVKPQEIRKVRSDLASSVRPSQLVISIAAGVTCRTLQTGLARVPVVRVMPNLPATIGSGFTALTLGRHATSRHRLIAAAIFEAVGEVVELPERLLDAVTALSGSGPAYLFFLAQVLEDAGRALGLPRAIAQRAVRRTLTGSVRLLDHGTRSPQEWITRVASKRGTTEAALRVLARHRVRQHFADALRAAAQRSKELSCSSPMK